MQLSMLLVLLLAATNAVVAATTTRSAREGGAEEHGKTGGLPEIAMAKPNCTDKCGNISIPYPFGIGNGCYYRPKFSITCKESKNKSEPTTPRLMESRMIVANISLEEGDVQIMQLVNRDCYNSDGMLTGNENQSVGGLSVPPPYTVSGAKNMLVAVGCDTYAHFVGSRGDQNYTTGCISVCQKSISGYVIDKNYSCSGMGCCETKIPPLLNNLSLRVESYRQHKPVWNFNPCGYAFVVQSGHFTFNNTSFQQLKNTPRLPLVLDWQVGDESCEYARSNGTLLCKGNTTCHERGNVTFACKGSTTCDERATGYICLCKPGFQGNPYLHDCQDIDECTTLKSRCKHGQCNNTVGNYTCICDSGYKNPEGDPFTCYKVPSTKRLKISLGVSLSFSVLVVTIFWIYRKEKIRRLEKLEKKYFKANGGANLEKKMSSSGKTARFFTEKEVKKATNDFDGKKIVGEGLNAIVYKGVLDQQEVAIKKSRDGAQINQKHIPAASTDQNQNTAAPTDQNQNTAASIDQKQTTAQEQSVNEITVLYQINHNNVVRLVGCCLTTETPIVVYEFINKGTLSTHIHGNEGKKPSSPLPLDERLKIAAETAGALAYLHHDTFMPIIHGDVKTANILLSRKKDEKLTPKLSDFKASRLVENQGSPLVHEAEVDVYSFGVVLAELLTSQMAISPEKPEAERELAKVFVSKVYDDLLDEILDQKIVKGHSGTVTKVADLTKRCLGLRGEVRPSMREVAKELGGLVRTMAPQHPSGGEASISPSPKGTGNLVGSSASSASLVDIKGDGDGDWWLFS